MCLAIPGKIIKIDKNMALVDFGGIKNEAALDLVPEAKIGDYVLVHAGFVINKIEKEDALEILELLDEINEFTKLPGPGINPKNNK